MLLYRKQIFKSEIVSRCNNYREKASKALKITFNKNVQNINLFNLIFQLAKTIFHIFM